MLSLCLGWVGGNAAEARELLSSAMLKAWEGAQKSREEIGNYRAWLARIVRNHCIDVQRRKNLDPQVKTDPEQLAPLAEQVRVTHQASPENNFLKDESYARLLARMEGLPTRLREVMMLRAYQNMSYKEIGRHLQISTENARKRVQMARSLLQAPEDEAAQDASAASEADAAEAILLQDRLPAAPVAHYALPVAMQFADHFREVPTFHAQRPMRLAQKAETLMRYLERHPGGWKKELELARLHWAMGLGDAALNRLGAAWERQPQLPELARTYLHMLHAAGDVARVAVVARASAACATLPIVGHLYTGFAAEAAGDHVLAAASWRSSLGIGGALLLAQLHLKAGDRPAADALLQAHLQERPMDREAMHWRMVAVAGTAAALPVAQHAARLFPQDAYIGAYLLAEEMRHLDTDGLRQLRTHIAEVVRLAPGSALMLALRVAWLSRQGLAAEAQALATEFVVLQPQHWQGREIAARMEGAVAQAGAGTHAAEWRALDMGLAFLA